MGKRFFYFVAFALCSFQVPEIQDRSNFMTSGNKHFPERTIEFSGYTWSVRNNNKQQGPGPNYFNDRCVWVDSKGYLHLIIQKDSTTGKWLCAELTTTKTFGFGHYQFLVDAPIDKFDKNLVLGLFNYSGNDGLDELDIEFARWGNSRYPNLNYTVWPADKAHKNYSYVKEFSINSTLSTQTFYWTKDSVVFTTMEGIRPGAQSLIATNTCTSPPNSISALPMPVHINFWLFEGKPTENLQTAEVVIRGFSYSAT